MRFAAQGLLSTVVALLAGFAVSAGVVAAAGSNPVTAFGALFAGAFGSLDGLSEVAVKTCPLLLTGLSVAVAFQAGIWNIGAEGQLLLGALLVAALGPRLAPLPGLLATPLLLLSAALAGGLWAVLAGVLKIWRGVSEVISTIMLNFVATAMVGYLVQGPLMEAGGRYPQTDALPAAFRLLRLAPPSRIHTGVMLAVALALLLAVVVRRTVFGYEIRAVGFNPRAARLAGIAVEWRGLTAFALSGALAGLAGGIEVAGVTYRMYERFSPGYGFTGIAVALLGRLDPLGVLAAGAFFGALDAGSNSMQRSAGISAVLVSVIQATVILFLVGLERRRWLPASKRAEGADATDPR